MRNIIAKTSWDKVDSHSSSNEVYTRRVASYRLIRTDIDEGAHRRGYPLYGDAPSAIRGEMRDLRSAAEKVFSRPKIMKNYRDNEMKISKTHGEERMYVFCIIFQFFPIHSEITTILCCQQEISHNSIVRKRDIKVFQFVLTFPLLSLFLFFYSLFSSKIHFVSYTKRQTKVSWFYSHSEYLSWHFFPHWYCCAIIIQ